MKGVWRDGMSAEFTKVALENCVPLDEVRLCQDLGYGAQDLVYMSHLLAPFGGPRDIRLEPVAIAMGARVIAKGWPTASVDAVKITRDEEKDALFSQAN
ncbi:uncharacterized protein A1O5_01403 [Cladophialophora psammophila CBS 110553]|uniref:Uncharacterized protein n=1 Tax=Cladophialophora psammophila CBS 110553 TaxID=1182543 RepID=W9XWS1_9EURO|nr:uncharacterized protein A1O5_01403 [Cladophialophora psammophila CBS 110553]EXJ74709.1 hypothetical protein A1O5_01403 [Cladophialophora psammophila CBS 110553]